MWKSSLFYITCLSSNPVFVAKLCTQIVAEEGFIACKIISKAPNAIVTGHEHTSNADYSVVNQMLTKSTLLSFLITLPPKVAP